MFKGPFQPEEFYDFQKGLGSKSYDVMLPANISITFFVCFQICPRSPSHLIIPLLGIIPVLT